MEIGWWPKVSPGSQTSGSENDWWLALSMGGTLQSFLNCESRMKCHRWTGCHLGFAPKNESRFSKRLRSTFDCHLRKKIFKKDIFKNSIINVMLMTQGSGHNEIGNTVSVSA